MVFTSCLLLELDVSCYKGYKTTVCYTLVVKNWSPSLTRCISGVRLPSIYHGPIGMYCVVSSGCFFLNTITKAQNDLNLWWIEDDHYYLLAVTHPGSTFFLYIYSSSSFYFFQTSFIMKYYNNKRIRHQISPIHRNKRRTPWRKKTNPIVRTE
jgi:hypothetical protein